MNRILVVEDEELIRTMVEINLESQKFKVRSCESAEDMMEILEEETFDVILLDIFLPGMNGDEALREIRKKSIQTPVIMVTAKSNLQTKLDSFEHGADDYISKPFDVQELQARV
ncbi:MAG: response regulator, partial [Planctomycetota bacterium]